MDISKNGSAINFFLSFFLSFFYSFSLRYDSFLKAPHVAPWATVQAPPSELFPSGQAIEYRTYCADITGGSGYLWGSCTF